MCAIYRNGATPYQSTSCVKVEAGLNVCSPRDYAGYCSSNTEPCFQSATNAFAGAIAAKAQSPGAPAAPPPPAIYLGTATCHDKKSATACASKVQKGKCTKNKSRKKCRFSCYAVLGGTC
mmetsp:Transcript_23095/g.61919  ORF Transcript_23095/g.61919 Transcript_23095/m.61919 type:complete len:120 (-) Transcript_23095:659-1018(-)